MVEASVAERLSYPLCKLGVLNDSSKAFATTNIGLVRTKARGKAKSGRKQPRPGDIKISERDDEPVITIQPTTDQDVEDTAESDSEAIVKEVRKSIESNIRQIGTNLSADAIGRIKVDIDNGWLDDSVIDCAQNLIPSQFPNIDGLQSCCYAQKPCFRPTTDTFIQILNTHPKGGGLHWVTVSTYENPVSGAVKLYDSSLALGVSTSIEKSVSNMLRSPESSISIKLMNSDIQPNINDCGVYAIAFAVSLAFGKSLLPFPFDLRTSRNFHGLLNVRQLRKYHGIFTDLRTNSNYGLFTEHSRTYGRTAITEISRNIHGFTDEQQLRSFHGTFTDLWTNDNYGNITEYSRIYECHGTVRG